MPDPRQGAAAAVANIIAAIDQLDSKERERLYVSLLTLRGAPSGGAASKTANTSSPNRVTVLANAATVLANPATASPTPDPLSARQPRRYLSESAAPRSMPMNYVTRPVDLRDASTWPLEHRRFFERVLMAPKGQLKLMSVSNATIHRGPMGPTMSSPRIEQAMPRETAFRFIDRFILPLLGTRLGQALLTSVIAGRHPVGVLWAVGKQRFAETVTTASNAEASASPRLGSPALVFIDERGDDWRAVPDLDVMPDIGFFHELVHVEAIQQGKNDGLTEREARIRENRYRDVRGAGFHRELP